MGDVDGLHFSQKLVGFEFWIRARSSKWQFGKVGACKMECEVLVVTGCHLDPL